MELIVTVKDSKAAFLLELLNNFSFVKAKPVPAKSGDSAELRQSLEEAVDYMKLVKSGKAQGRPAQALLDEL